MPDNGEDIMVDLGLPLVFPGAGDGEPVLENGLLRFCDAISCVQATEINMYRFETEAKYRQAIQSSGA